MAGGELRPQRAAVFAGEHQAGVVPRGAPGCTFDVLHLLVPAKDGDCVVIDGDEAGSALGLGGSDDPASVDLGDLLHDGHAPALRGTGCVGATREQVTITKNGSPAAVLIGVDEWESIQESLFWLSQPGIRESIAEAEADVEEGRVYSEEQIRAEFNVPKGER